MGFFGQFLIAKMFASVSKFRSGQTSISSTTRELTEITYPSVTVCHPLGEWGMEWKAKVEAQSDPNAHRVDFNFTEFLNQRSLERHEFLSFFTHSPANASGYPSGMYRSQ